MGSFSVQGALCVYSRGAGQEQVIIVMYMDDMLVMAPCRLQVDEVKQAILNKWKIEDNGPVMEFLKIKIMRDQMKWTMDLDQWAYIKEIIKEWIEPDDKTWIPMTTTPMKATDELMHDKKLRETYPALVGKLLWVSNTVCPDICHAVNTLVQHMS